MNGCGYEGRGAHYKRSGAQLNRFKFHGCRLCCAVLVISGAVIVKSWAVAVMSGGVLHLIVISCAVIV